MSYAGKRSVLVSKMLFTEESSEPGLPVIRADCNSYSVTVRRILVKIKFRMICGWKAKISSVACMMDPTMVLLRTSVIINRQLLGF